MADTKAKQPSGKYDLTAPAYLLFPKNVFEKKPGYQGKGEPRHEVGIAFPADHPDLPGIKTVLRSIAEAASPGVDTRTIKSPLLKGSDLSAKLLAGKNGEKYKEAAEFEKGKVVILSKSKIMAKLSVIVPGQGLVKLSDDALIAKYRDKFFFGAEVIVSYLFQWYAPMAQAPFGGITSYANLVLANGKGTKIGGGWRTEEEAFAGYLGKMSGESPLAGASADEEIPF